MQTIIARRSLCVVNRPYNEMPETGFYYIWHIPSHNYPITTAKV